MPMIFINTVIFYRTYLKVLQVTDGSPFSLKERWMLVWDTELPNEFFNVFVQKFIKSVLSVIVAVRCSTTYAYVVSAMLVIFCILKSSSPKLMLLWLLVAGVKSVFMTFLEALTGVYVCSAFGNIRKACIEFFISKALELIFAAYLWGNVLNIYQEMERKAESSSVLPTKEELFLQNFNTRARQRARSLVDESTLYRTACLNNFEFRDVPQIILQMLRRSDEMSHDSLLGSGMMLASVSNLGSFESLKISQSLGELGFVDLETTEVFGLDEDETLSYQEKALRFLKLTRSDVLKLKQNKTNIGNDIYTMDQDTWKSVVATGTRIHKPKQARTQVFIRDIPELESEEGSKTSIKPRKKSADKKFGFSFSDFFNERQFMFEENQDDEIFSLEESDDVSDNDDDDDDNEDESNIFMSNIKEGIVVNPNRLGIVSKKLKKNAYEELYKQDFMSTIGPEVFDKAPKLLRVTSLGNINRNLGTRTSVSLPALPDVKTTKMVSIFEINGISSSDLHFESLKENDDSLQPSDSSQEEQSNTSTETKSEKDLKKDKNLIIFPLLKSNSLLNEKARTLKKNSDDGQYHRVNSKPSLCSMDLTIAEIESREDTKDRPSYRKKRVIIGRTEKKKRKTWSRTPSSDGQHLSNNSSFSNSSKSRAESESSNSQKDVNIREKMEILSSDSEISDSVNEYKTQDEYKKQIHFLIELFQKPLLDVLVTYHDLKKKVHVQKTSNTSKSNRIEYEKFPLQNFRLKRYEKILHSLEHFPKENKIWKSKVLKTVELVNRPGRVDSLSSLTRKDLFLKKLLKYEVARLKSKNFRNLQLHSRDSTNWSSAKSDKIRIADDSIISKLENSVNLHPDSEETESEKKESFVSICKNVVEEGTLKCAQGNKSCPTKEESELIKTKSSTNIEKEQTTPQNLAVKSSATVIGSNPEGESLSSQDSDEPISLYYSKAANLASPLFDMKRFIYPDHIHYSYKHVKKKGFDVDINGGLPLLVRESLTMGSPPQIGGKPISKNPESEITRKPMDLSFAATNAFAEWQNNEQIDVDVTSSNSISSGIKDQNSSDLDINEKKKIKSTKRKKNSEHKAFIKSKPTSVEGNFNQKKYLYSANDYLLIEKLLKMHKQFNDSEFESERTGRKPMQISSTQLHSNKGRINSTYNPAIFLQENKSRNERRKVESQEERTKDMFARLEREALLQSKNVHKSFAPNRG